MEKCKKTKNFFKRIFNPNYVPGRYLWGILRIVMGWVFLWPFLDKLFGLGYATPSGQAWLDGASPTYGFLKFATRGPLAVVFQGMAGSPLVDWLFMLGLLFIGLALISGIFMKIASYSGALMLLLMWLAAFPPEHNPFLDEHLIYIVILIALGIIKAGRYFGLGEKWRESGLVKKYPLFE
ncbi:DoxX family membrane protein [Candidatus Falkowbacteria bacterium]|nr:DoxX family membrane protein [Candidatus Falkowbacteria bacterium]